MAKIDLRIVEGIAWLSRVNRRIKIAVGGRGSAKSIGVADIMIGCCDQGERICCGREFQNSIDDSVHENLKEEIDRLGAEGFTVLGNGIYSSGGGEIFYKGLARNITSLKSLAGVDKLWIEEGEAVSKQTLKILTPSIRSKAAANEAGDKPPEIWITMNRGSRAGAVAEKYLARAEAALAKQGWYIDDLIAVVDLNYRDNPWFPPELEQERLDDLKHLSRAEYRAIWEGEYFDEVENSIIPQEHFDACIDAHLKLGFKPSGAKVVAHDPSDMGRDPKGYAARHGSVFVDIKSYENVDINEGCILSLADGIEFGMDVYVYDYGFGAGLKGQISQGLNGKGIHYEAFNGADGPDFPNQKYQPLETDNKKNSKTNKETFKNKRAQYYFMLADHMANTYRAVEKGEYVDPDKLISISSEIAQLNQVRTEVCRIPQVFNLGGKRQIMAKPDMKKLLKIDSPNMADSMMMAMISPLARTRKTHVQDVPAVNPYASKR